MTTEKEQILAEVKRVFADDEDFGGWKRVEEFKLDSAFPQGVYGTWSYTDGRLRLFARACEAIRELSGIEQEGTFSPAIRAETLALLRRERGHAEKRNYND